MEGSAQSNRKERAATAHIKQPANRNGVKNVGLQNEIDYLTGALFDMTSPEVIAIDGMR
jgi:hypothetical protein